jgi:hypothetical protein
MTRGIQELTHRGEKLERQNRRLKQAAVSVLSLVAIAGLMAQASPKRTVEAEKFILRDARGRARVTIGTPGVAGAAYLMQPDEPAIWISDATASDRAILTVDGVRLANGKGKPLLDLTSGRTDRTDATFDPVGEFLTADIHSSNNAGTNLTAIPARRQS